ncbi:hypothetical protein ASG41_03645 [Modestobacter sp. Leaf380]|nr:hypothetical protein ASG41_03645 [Modestobacter sp. Leaf380]
MAASVAVLLVDAALLGAGVLSIRTAGQLALAVEFPLAAVGGWAGTRAYRALRRGGSSAREAVEAVLGQTAVRVATAEWRALRALWLVARRRTDLPAGATALPYGRGVTVPALAFLGVTVVETAVVHVLLPAGWVRVVLTAVTVYACVAVVGLVAARVAYPHHVTDGVLRLRNGVQDVLDVPLRHLAAVRPRRDIRRVGLLPAVEDGTLYLPSLDGTSLTIELTTPVATRVTRRRPPVPVTRIELSVDDPRSALAQVQSVAAAVRERPVPSGSPDDDASGR